MEKIRRRYAALVQKKKEATEHGMECERIKQSMKIDPKVEIERLLNLVRLKK